MISRCQDSPPNCLNSSSQSIGIYPKTQIITIGVYQLQKTIYIITDKNGKNSYIFGQHMEIPSMVMLPLLASVRPWIAMYVCSSYSGQKHVLSLHTIRDAARSALSFGVKSS